MLPNPLRALVAVLLLGAALTASSTGLPAARADVIYQPGGGKIVGEIVEEKDDYVGIKTRAGTIMRVPRDEIDKIERGPVEPPKPLPVAPRPLETPKPGDASKAAPLPPPPGGVKPLEPGKSGGGRLGAPSTEPTITFGIDEEALQKPREKAVREWFERHGAKLRAAIQALLKSRRKEAIEFIMDPTKYPEANHGAVAQPEVDRLVGLLRRAWEDPFAEALEVSADLRRLVEELEEVGDSEAIRAKVNKALAPAAEPPAARDAAAVDANAKSPGDADAEERACDDATNAYRAMFGLRILRMDDRLLRAARKHSKNMVDLGFFDHTSPVKGMETPERRVSAEGARYSAENIAFGSSTGQDAFLQWYNSSGHHRNILGDHLTIGVGRSGTHWTQNFGTDPPK